MEQELAAEPLQDPLDAHSVLEDAIQDQASDLIVEMGLGHYIPGSLAEGLAASALRRVLALGGLEVSDRLVGDCAYFAGIYPFSLAQLATLGTRGLLGSAVNWYKDSLWVHPCP